MKQSKLSFLLFVLMSMISNKASAYSFSAVNEDGVVIYYNYDNMVSNAVRVTKREDDYCSYSGIVRVPATVTFSGKTYNVTDIDGAFSNCNSLTSIVIPSSVTSIGSSAFYGCSGLTSIEIPSSVTSIGSSAFSGCSELTSIVIPNSVTSIGSSAFSGCSELTSIVIPNSVTSIGFGAFSNCSSLISFVIPNSVTSIGSSAFYECRNLTSITVESGNTVYDSRDNCNAIIKSNSNTLICGCKNTTIPSSVTSIGSYAFSGCSGLSSIEIPSSVTSIGDYAFSGCKILTSITLGDYIPTGGDNVLEDSYLVVFVPTSRLDAYKTADGWSNYTSRILPIGTQTVYDLNVTAKNDDSDIHAQIGESNLNHVIELKLTGTINSYDIMIMRDKMPNLRKLDLTDANIEASSYTYITNYSTSKDTWKYGMCPSSLGVLKLPSSLKTISDYAFEDINNMINIEIPEGVETIGMGAFHGCKVVTSIPKSVKTIGEGAFDSCSGLVNVDLSNSNIQSIGCVAFIDCSHLKTVDLSDTKIELIGGLAFLRCSKMEKLILRRSEINTIGSGAFLSYFLGRTSYNDYKSYSYANYGVSSAYRQHRNFDSWSFKTNTFWGCTNMDVDFLDVKIGTIGQEAFSGTKVNEVNLLNSSVGSIGTKSFYKCPRLEKVDLANSTISSILSDAFLECVSLESVDFSNCSIATIGANAFKGCSNLETVTLTGCTKLTTIGTYAFADTKLAEIRIPSTVTSIGDNAFNCSTLTNVYAQSILPRTIDVSTFSTTSTKNGTLHVPSLSYKNYYWATNWSQFAHIVEDTNPDYFYIDDDLTVQDGKATDDPVDADITATSGIVVQDEDQTFDEVTVSDNGTNSGSLIPGANTTVNILNLNITVTANKWQFISFPYRVKLSDVVAPGFFVFRRYDGAKRANTGGTGWASLLDGTEYLEPGVGYIFQSSQSGTLGIRSENPDLSWGSGKTNPLSVYTTDNIQHASWNFVGNPMLCYYDIDDLHTTAPLTFWNGSSYVARRPGDDNYQLRPFEAFFLQKPNDVEALVYEKSGRMTYKQAQEHHNNKNNNARASERSERFLINLSLTQGQWEDEARVVYNNKKTPAYEPDCDAAKFMSTMSVPQLYAIEGNVQMAIDERPWGEVQLGFIATAEGEHTITATRLGTNVLLRDNLLNITHDLSLGGYTFTTEAGTFNDRFTLVPEAETTGINALNEKGEMRNEKFFDLQGRRTTDAAQKGIRIVRNRKVVK